MSSLYLFNPAPLIDISHWGMMADPFYMFFILMAFVTLSLKSVVPAWIFLTLGILTKPQALVYAPLIMVATFRRYDGAGILKGLLGAVMTALLVYSPFIVHGTFWEAFHIFSKPIGTFPFLHLAALNGWYLVTLGQLVSDAIPLFWRLTYRHLGLFLFGTVYLWTVLCLHKQWDWKDLFVRAAFIGFAFFMLPTEIHENYLIVILPFLLIAAAFFPAFKFFYVFLSLTTFLNIALRSPWITSILLKLLPGRRGFLLVTAMTISLLNLTLFLSWFLLVRKTWGIAVGELSKREDPRIWVSFFSLMTGCAGLAAGIFSFLGRSFILSVGRNFLIHAAPFPRKGLNYLILGVSERPFEFYWQHFESLVTWAPLILFLASGTLVFLGRITLRHTSRHPFYYQMAKE